MSNSNSGRRRTALGAIHVPRSRSPTLKPTAHSTLASSRRALGNLTNSKSQNVIDKKKGNIKNNSSTIPVTSASIIAKPAKNKSLDKENAVVVIEDDFHMADLKVEEVTDGDDTTIKWTTTSDCVDDEVDCFIGNEAVVEEDICDDDWEVPEVFKKRFTIGENLTLFSPREALELDAAIEALAQELEVLDSYRWPHPPEQDAPRVNLSQCPSIDDIDISEITVIPVSDDDE
eukprot:TRINITY_DN33042_c0_g2_i3.p2 TRINITY_DN33042_c0_g2~~TRINITY_DN33042_c0_g2_i3.p2  ORF type:complete len:231 (+),score=69.27 TRINITY_DN33042_c0_g2_i3:1643-2335(+)